MFGYSQTTTSFYQLGVGAGRNATVTYTNSTGKPIVVYVVATSAIGTLIGYVDGYEVAVQTNQTIGGLVAVTLTVLPNSTYAIATGPGITVYDWVEIR